MNEYYDTMIRLRAAFRGISKDDHSDWYNYNVQDSHVLLGWVPPEDAPGLGPDSPFICVSVLSSRSASIPVDQQTDEVSCASECYGYIKCQTDPMGKALKLLNDMMSAIFQDEFLCSTVFNSSIEFDVATLGEFGVVILRIGWEMSLAKPA